MSHRKRSTGVALAAVLVTLLLVPAPMLAADSRGDGGAADRSTSVSVDEAVDIAIDHVQGNAAEHGVETADVAELVVASAYRSRHTRVTHVNLNQRHQGLEVFGAYATVNVSAAGEVLFVGDSLVGGLTVASADSELGAIEAVEAAADALDLDEPEGLRLVSRRGGPAQESVVSEGGISDEPIPARKGWQPTKGGLRLAWQLVIDDSSDVHLWNATVDAASGRLLDVDDWTSDNTAEGLASFLGRTSGPSSSASLALASAASSGPSTPNPVIDGSSYRVFELPKESPNDGGRTLVTNPADATASPFGWHDVSGTPDPDFTTTRGNNVHAYTDRDADNQPDPGSDPDGGPSLTFDFPLDLNEHAYNSADAAVANLFYWCNVNHDIQYLYGFDEASGNFQVNNYGRGGVGGDDVRCEAQDGAGDNNANFLTPAMDGGRPRMQMFLWPGLQFGLPNTVTVDSGTAAGAFPAHFARFTPSPTTAGDSGEIALVTSGPSADFPAALPNEGCGPFVGFPAGAIALVDRGTCPFLLKVQNAEAAGAVAVIVANNVAGAPIIMAGSMADPVGIPAVMISQANGDTIKAGLPATGTVRRNLDRPPIRDGDLEAGIVAHEYSHGVSLRLTGGPTTNCLTGQEQMGEGWSDWHAIAMLLDPALDDPEGPRGMGPYALFQDSRQGAGIRPRPYSRNMEIQPFTYDGIKTNGWLNGTSLSVPHGIGHGWAATLWDMTWDLIDKHGFNPNLYEPWSTGGNNLAYQLVNDGLKFQGCGPGFVVGRDAIIAADQALTGGENACTLWATFARRGLGFSAVQGTSANRNDNDEAFDTHPDCLRGFRTPVHAPYGTLNTFDAGDTVPLRFTADGHRGLDVLASNSPYSRRVDCDTLATVDPDSEFITPRPIPVATETPGNSRLSVNNAGLFTYPWKTLADWAGTCRELVLTRMDGAQHRAFFRFN